MTKLNKQQKIGIALLAIPIPLLICVLAFYAVFTFIIATMTDAGFLMLIFSNVVYIVLGTLGFLALIGIPVSMPIGVVLLVKSAKKK